MALGELLEIHVLPAYTSPLAIGKNILEGMNYASAAGGILEETGQNLITLNELRRQMEDGEFSYYLGKAIVVMTLGSNDYINNYLQPSYTSSYLYTPQDYADLLINRYATQILAVERLGVMKFFLGGIGPLGCIPNHLATRVAPPAGKCIAYTNDIVNMFNKRLASLVDELNHKYNGSIFAYANTFGVFTEILNNAKNYGFDVTDRGCCGIGRNQGQITCLPLSGPCANRNKYIFWAKVLYAPITRAIQRPALFWDAFHPTQAANQILAHRAYSGSSPDCYPVNVHQMALL
ncbi:hypothetical protein ACS0TY_030661 [Phlomoides rotata]